MTLDSDAVGKLRSALGKAEAAKKQAAGKLQAAEDAAAEAVEALRVQAEEEGAMQTALDALVARDADLARVVNAAPAGASSLSLSCAEDNGEWRSGDNA